ncbi:MAG: 50S ribosomal protein L25 [Candidatus Margulisiibacteriota bacterium]|nr:50S ribosomal protein L25 [Candidatus Margulisiibacteriota bacterium]
MVAKVELKASKREDLGKKAKNARRQGLIPAVVYGRKFKAMAISVDNKEFIKKIIKSEAGHNLIFTLKISDDGVKKDIPVITHSVQQNPMTDDIIHLDFMHVVMDEAIKTEVPVELLGVPIGVKEDGGVLVHGLREIEVKCLPGDIPDKYELDVTVLKVNDSLHVSDIKLSNKIEILTSEGEMLASVSSPTKEEEEAPPPATPEEAVAATAEGEDAVADEQVKEKAAPGAAPAKAEKPAAEEKKEKK